MFGLAEQVERDPIGIIVAIGDHKDFRRAGDHVDADLPEDTAFCGSDKGVSGARDLIDRSDRLGAIGQSSHSLCAADPVNLIHPRKACGQQDKRVGHPVRRGHRDDQPAHPGDTGRDRVHQHG